MTVYKLFERWLDTQNQDCHDEMNQLSIQWEYIEKYVKEMTALLEFTTEWLEVNEQHGYE